MQFHDCCQEVISTPLTHHFHAPHASFPRPSRLGLQYHVHQLVFVPHGDISPWGPRKLHFLGANELPLRQAFGLYAPDGAARCRSRGQKQAPHALGFNTTFTSLFLSPTETYLRGDPENFTSSGQMNCPCGKPSACTRPTARLAAARVVKNTPLTPWASIPRSPACF